MIMTEDKTGIPDKIVKRKYEEIMQSGLPFLQIFPQMFQESNIAETFKLKKSQRNRNLSASSLDVKESEINEFREQLLVHCGMNLSIFKLPSQTQAAFWFMLFNWIECNNYSITIGPEKRKILAQYYSRSKTVDPNSRAVQNILRGLTKCGLLVKCKKTDSICKDNKTYEITYKVPFIVSQQKISKNFIRLNQEIIQLKSELRKRSIAHLKGKGKTSDIELDNVEEAINGVLNSVVGKVSKRNIEALGRVQFSARIDFSAECGLTIDEISNITNIEPNNLNRDYVDGNLKLLLNKVRTKKQKQLLELHYHNLKQIYMVQGEKAFNKELKTIDGLGRKTKLLMLSSFV